MTVCITDYTLYWLFFFGPILKLALGCCCRVPVLPSVYCLSLAQMVKLQACIKYCEEDYSAAKVRSFNTSSVNTRYHFCSVQHQINPYYAQPDTPSLASLSVVFLQSLLEQLPPDDPDYVYNMGCLLYQDGKYEEACRKFMSAMQVLGYVPGDQLKTHIQ